MSVRILYDSQKHHACLYDSVTDWAFGPVFQDQNGYTAIEQATWFTEWLQTEDGRDARIIPSDQLETIYARWPMLGGDQ